MSYDQWRAHMAIINELILHLRNGKGGSEQVLAGPAADSIVFMYIYIYNLEIHNMYIERHIDSYVQ